MLRIIVKPAQPASNSGRVISLKDLKFLSVSIGRADAFPRARISADLAATASTASDQIQSLPSVQNRGMLKRFVAILFDENLY